MATTLLVYKRLGSLHPCDDEGVEALSKLAQREVVKITYTKPRNLKFTRKFFKMLEIIFHNQEHYKTQKALLHVCKMGVGHYDVIEKMDGSVSLDPKSISFANMDDTEFSRFYNRAVDWMLAEIIPDLRRDDLDAEVEAELMEFAM